MAFARPEDGAFNTRNDDEHLWVTTGGAAGANVLGRIHNLDLDERDPARAAVVLPRLPPAHLKGDALARRGARPARPRRRRLGHVAASSALRRS